jgi:hypothetical protein
MESDWHRMISEAAYYLAQKRGFSAGSAVEDWLLAELQIKEILSGRQDTGRTAQPAHGDSRAR